MIASTERVLQEHVEAGDFCAYVIEEHGAIVAYGIGMIHQRLPSDHNPSGRWGYVQSMETRPDRRGRGHGGLVLMALLDWYREERVPAVNLVASATAESLYRRLGFVDEPLGHWLLWLNRPVGSVEPPTAT